MAAPCGLSLLLFRFLVVCIVTAGCRVHANADAKRLYDDLINGYNSLIRPVGNNSDRLTVKMGLKLAQLMDVNLKSQIMTTNVWVEQEWNDYKLKWEPEEYGGVSKLHVPAEQIWLPDIVLYNNADGNYEVTIMTKAILHYDGLVIWKPPAIYKSSCQIDVEYFPFDQQTCFMKFGSWTYDGYTVDLKHKYQKGDSSEILIGMDLTAFYLSVEWDIMSVPARRKEKYYSCCEEPYPDITFNVTLRRKTLFYTVNLICPCILISALSVIVFYLPSDSGEKVSLSISIMLSLGVFFLLLVEIIPPTSLTVPLLGRYLLFTMILVTLSVMLTIVVLNVNFRSPATHRMAPWVKRFFLHFLPRLLCMSRPSPDGDGNDNDGHDDGVDETHDNCNGINNDFKTQSGHHFQQYPLESVKGHPGHGLPLPTYAVRRFSGQSCEGSEMDFPPPPPPDKLASLHRQYVVPGTLEQQVSFPGSGTDSGQTGHTPPPYNSISLIGADGNETSMPMPLYEGHAHQNGSDAVANLEMLGNAEPGGEFAGKRNPDLEHALLSVRFVAQHMENLDNYCEVEADWKFVAMVLDRLFLWIFIISCVAGTCGIILQAPTLYDANEPIDVLFSKVGSRIRRLGD